MMINSVWINILKLYAGGPAIRVTRLQLIPLMHDRIPVHSIHYLSI